MKLDSVEFLHSRLTDTFLGERKASSYMSKPTLLHGVGETLLDNLQKPEDMGPNAQHAACLACLGRRK